MVWSTLWHAQEKEVPMFNIAYPGLCESTMRIQVERLSGLIPGSQGQNLALTFLYVPYVHISSKLTGAL